MVPRRARPLGDTYQLARAAAARAGVTRLADIGGLGGLGLPVFLAVRPYARSLTVSLGKGASPLAAKVSALLEAAELACAEDLPRPATSAPLRALPKAARECWSGDRPPLAINLDPGLHRAWVMGRILGSDEPMAMPWDLLSLDFTSAPLEFPAGSDGLATGNTRDEAVFAALCELVEHDLLAWFETLSPRERRSIQIDTKSIPDSSLARELRRVTAAGFTPRMWSLGQEHDIAAISCVLFPPEPVLDQMAPVTGSAVHPDSATAALAALREAVQARAALVAGTRDDLVPEDYRDGRRRTRAMAIATLAIGEGVLAWAAVPGLRWSSMASGIALLRETMAQLSPLPVVVFDHPSPVPGLHVVHALAPGLRNLSREKAAHAQIASARPCRTFERRVDRRGPVLFAGPSAAGLTIPPQVEVLPPAVCGDLSALLGDPPAAVGLVDGYFGLAPSVWHKEILALLARGVSVLGAASLGALRAAELADAGMEGVGEIYAAYRASAIERDDAVMLLHAPAAYGFAPFTLPLVDAEYALNAADCRTAERRAMQRIVRTMPYTLRTWRACLDAYRVRTGREFSLHEVELAQFPSLKQRDTAQLISRLADVAREGTAGPASRAPPMTSYFLRMLARTSQVVVAGHEPRNRGDPAREAAASAEST